MQGFLPTPPGVALGVGIGTYAGRVSLSVATLKHVVPDANELLGFMLDEHLAYVHAAGMVLPAPPRARA